MSEGSPDQITEHTVSIRLLVQNGPDKRLHCLQLSGLAKGDLIVFFPRVRSNRSVKFRVDVSFEPFLEMTLYSSGRKSRNGAD